MLYLSGRNLFTLLAWLLVGLCDNGLAQNSATGAISAVATVTHPVGLLTCSTPDMGSTFVLYCPTRGHVICSVAYVQHVKQIGSSHLNPAVRLRHESLLSGQTVSPVSVAGLLSAPPVDTEGCVLTVIYTEN